MSAILTFNLFPPPRQQRMVSEGARPLGVSLKAWGSSINIGFSWTSESQSDREWTIGQKDLPDGEPYQITKEIPVKITKAGELDFIAAFDEANISIGGISKRDAFQSLVYDLLDAFDYLSAHQTELGPEPRRQLIVLSRHLAKIHF